MVLIFSSSEALSCFSYSVIKSTAACPVSGGVGAICLAIFFFFSLQRYTTFFNACSQHYINLSHHPLFNHELVGHVKVAVKVKPGALVVKVGGGPAFIKKLKCLYRADAEAS